MTGLDPRRRASTRGGRTAPGPSGAAARARVAASAFLLCAVGWAGTGRCDEGQWRLGARVGGAWLDSAGLGPSASAVVARGLGPWLDFEACVTGSLHPWSTAPNGNGDVPADRTVSGAWSISPALTYRWDVLRAVPHLSLGVGVYGWQKVKAQLENARFGAPLRLGVDYLLTREVVLGAQATVHFVAREDGLAVPWVQVGMGASHAWGW